MPVFDQGYQHWNGTLAGHASRWLAITRQGVRSQVKNRWTKYLIIASWTPALALAGLLGLWGLFEQKSDAVQPFLFLFQWLPEDIREGPRAFRGSIWTILFHLFFSIEQLTAMILVLLVGPDLISQDLRFNATPLYFSRPLRRRDYFVGKLGVIAVFLLGVTAVPATMAYLIGVAFSLEPSVLAGTWRLFLGGLAYSLVVAVVAGLIMLAFSSLSRNSRNVAMLWLGFWLVGDMMGAVLASTINRTDDEKTWRVVSMSSNLTRVREALIGTEEAQAQLNESFQAAFAAAREQMSGGFGGGGRRRGGLARLFRPRPPEPPPPDVPPGFNMGQPDRMPPFLEILVSPFPWQASALVLAGLCGGSLWILSTRVKSLDRRG